MAKFQWVDLFQDDGFEHLQIAINIGMERLGIIRPIRLRSEPLDNLSEDDVKIMLRENDFFDKGWHWMGKGIRHQYELLKDGQVVFDKTTGLTWQRFGSEMMPEFVNTVAHIRNLNDQRLAGYNDWRLPTLEESMSLMEPKKHGELYIDSVFDKRQKYIWTADKKSARVAWKVSFDQGSCKLGILLFSYGYWVRAVR